MGYYAGCVRTWRQLEQQRPGCIPQRAQRVIAAMEQLLAGFPLHDPLVRAARSSDMLGPPLTGATGLPSCTPPLCSKGGGGGLLQAAWAGSAPGPHRLPRHWPQDEALHDSLEALRGRFKAAAASLGKAGEYLAPRDSQQGSSVQPAPDLSF